MRFWTVAAALCLISPGAFAADVATKGKVAAPAPEPAKPLIAWPEPNMDWLGSGFDYAYGVKFMSNYMNRGMSNSADRPSATAYGELRYGWLYGGVQPWKVNLPTQPGLELDLYGGIRPTWGPLTLDFGVIGYLYPGNDRRYWLAGAGGSVLPFYTQGGIPTTPQDITYMEAYWKGTWQINDWFALGTAFYYSPNWVNTGAQSLYSEVNAKITFPDTGVSLSGAFGHQYIGRSNYQYGFSYVDNSQYYTGIPRGYKYSSYNTWNVGASYLYQNTVTFDVRYYGSSLGQIACNSNMSDPAGNAHAAVMGVGRSSWCGSKVVGGVSVDFTSATFKVADSPSK